MTQPLNPGVAQAPPRVQEREPSNAMLQAAFSLPMRHAAALTGAPGFAEGDESPAQDAGTASGVEDNDAIMAPRRIAGHKRGEPDSGFDAEGMPDHKRPAPACVAGSQANAAQQPARQGVAMLQQEQSNSAEASIAWQRHPSETMPMDLDATLSLHDPGSSDSRAGASMEMNGANRALLRPHENGNLPAVEESLGMSGIDPDAASTRGGNALIFAASRGAL